MIVGVGVDIVEIRRMEKILQENADGFLNKIFTAREIIELRNRKLRPEFVAGRFAAKEAVAKALGTGIRGFSFRDIEVYNNELGKPLVNLYGKAEEILKESSSGRMLISISHGEDNAIAYAVFEEA